MPASANATIAWPEGKLGPCRDVSEHRVGFGRAWSSPVHDLLQHDLLDQQLERKHEESGDGQPPLAQHRDRGDDERHERDARVWTPTIGVSSASGRSLIERNTDCSAADTTPSRTRISAEHDDPERDHSGDAPDLHGGAGRVIHHRDTS